MLKNKKIQYQIFLIKSFRKVKKRHDKQYHDPKQTKAQVLY